MMNQHDYPDCEWVDFKLLETFVYQCLCKSGVPEADAAIVTDVLIESDKRGIDSHGIGRLKPIYIDRIDQGILKSVTKITMIKETPSTAVLDGNNGMGHVISKKAMQMAVEKAQKQGLGMVVVRNSTHYGIAGYYATMATDADMIGVTGTNARPSIAPTHGVENMLGTNPLVFGIPTDEPFPFVIDCATSVSQRGKIEMYARLGKSLPPGWVIGKDGKTRTDTEEVLRHLKQGIVALSPLGGIGEENGGYKGYGYATVVEVLSAALQNGSYLKALNGVDKDGKKIPYPLGHFFLAINIENFISPSLFKKIAGSIMRDLRQSEKVPGEERIYTAGEKEYETWIYRRKHGCPIPKPLQVVITGLKERWQLQLDFPWE